MGWMAACVYQGKFLSAAQEGLALAAEDELYEKNVNKWS